jgi:hypothetical protein
MGDVRAGSAADFSKSPGVLARQARQRGGAMAEDPVPANSFCSSVTTLRPGVRRAPLRGHAAVGLEPTGASGVPRAPLPPASAVRPATGQTIHGVWGCRGCARVFHGPCGRWPWPMDLQAHRPFQLPSSSSAAAAMAAGPGIRGGRYFIYRPPPRYLRAVQSVSCGRD